MKRAILLLAISVLILCMTLNSSPVAQQARSENKSAKRVAAIGTPTDVITFENIPSVGVPQEGMQISTQFLETAGVTFVLEGGGFPQIAQVGEPATAFRGPPNNTTPDTPAPGQEVGMFFLTDNGQTGGAEVPPLIVQYNPPTAAASGVIIDIDPEESFTIEARDANGQVIEQIMLPGGQPGTGDGIATPWSFDHPSDDIFSIRFAGVKLTGSGVGLAFDNFSARSAEPQPPPPTQAMLDFKVAVSDDPVQPEQRYYYTVIVGNVTPSSFFEDLEVSVFTPDHVVFEFRTTSEPTTCLGAVANASRCDSGQRLVWSIPILGPGESRAIRIPVKVKSADEVLFGSLIETQFQVDYTGSPALLTAEETVEVKRILPPSTLDVQIAATPEPLAPGGEVAYTLTFSNAGQGDALEAMLSAVLPNDVEFISATDGGVLVGDMVQWNLGGVGSGQGGRRSVTVRDLLSQQGRVLRAEAQVQDNTGDTFDQRATAGTAVQSGIPVDLAVTSDDTELMLSPSQRYTYIVAIRNTSASTFLEGLEVSVFTPDHVVFEFRTTSEPTACLGAAANASRCDSGQRLVWSIGTLSPNEVRELRIPTLVNDNVIRGSLVVAPFESRSFLGQLVQRVGNTLVYIVDNGL